MTDDAARAANRTATVPYRVRFDECGPDGLARMSALLRYAQDVAWIHSERLGFDRDWYAARGLTWLVRAAEVALVRAIPLGTTIDVSTTVAGFRKVWARRRTDGRLADGTLAFWAHTDWVIIDARGAPTRIPAEFPDVYGEMPGPFDPGRVPLPPTPPGATLHRLTVRPADLDPLGHVNNAAYLDYLEETVLAAGDEGAAALARAPRSVRLEYLLATVAGATPEGAAWRVGDGPDGPDDAAGWAWRLSDEAGTDLARGRILAGTDDSTGADGSGT
jgi:acyl-CoA thioesterase FadM